VLSPNTSVYHPVRAHDNLFRCRVEVAAFRVHGAGLRVQGSELRVQGAGFRVLGAGFRVPGAGFKVQGYGCRVRGSGCRVQGSGSWSGRAGQHPLRPGRPPLSRHPPDRPPPPPLSTVSLSQLLYTVSCRVSVVLHRLQRLFPPLRSALSPTGVPRFKQIASPWEPTVGLYLGSYGGPKEGGGGLLKAWYPSIRKHAPPHRHKSVPI